MRTVNAFALLVLAGVLSFSSCKKTVENSCLFRKHIDAETGVVSYVLKEGVYDENSQSLYFTNKSMTDDGRFILARFSNNEARNHHKRKDLCVIDIANDAVIPFNLGTHENPFLDPQTDVVYFFRKEGDNPGFYKRNLLEDPAKDIKICDFPKELTSLGKLRRVCTHLTLNHDRTKAFLDTRVDDRFIQGLMNFEDGSFDIWSEVDFCLNHGMIHPFRDDIALAAYETEWTDSLGVLHKRQKIDGFVPRHEICTKGKVEHWPHLEGYKSYHERWDENGDGFYFCEESVYYQDLKTKKITKVSPMGIHAFMTKDLKYVVSDQYVDNYYRGHAWRVYFFNRETNQGIFVHSFSPAVATVQDPSDIHPDPHPQFVCNDKYVICTFNGTDGNTHLSVTPVKQLIKKTSKKLSYPKELQFQLEQLDN